MTNLNQLLQALNSDLGAGLPRRVGVRQLNQETGRVLNTLRDRNETAVITYRGVPSFLLVPIQAHELATLVLASGPDLWAEDMAEANAILAKDLASDGVQSSQFSTLRPKAETPPADVDAGDLQARLMQAVRSFDPDLGEDAKVVGVNVETADANFAQPTRPSGGGKGTSPTRSAKA